MAAAYGLDPITTPAGEDVHANQYTLILGVSIALIVIPTCVVFLRFVARLLSKAGLWWDDWFVLLGLLCSTGLSALQIYSLSIGFGQHMEAQGDFLNRLNVAEYWFKLFYAYETIYLVSVFCCKMSILLFYSRIFKERRFIFWLRVTIGVVVAHFLAGEITTIAECIPIGALWDPTIEGTCIDLIKYFDAHGGINAVIDFIVLVLPLPMIWSLEIERHHKWALSGVFMLGSFVVIAAVVRVVVLSQLAVIDITYEFINGALWTAAEPSIAVTSASLPILRSLWIWNRRKNSNRYGTDTPDSYTEENKQQPPSRPAGFHRGPTNTGHELPAGVQHAPAFGNHVSVGAGAGSYAESRKLSDEDQSYALPIQHPHEAGRALPPVPQQAHGWQPQRPAYAQWGSETHYQSERSYRADRMPLSPERSMMSPHRSMMSHEQSIRSPARNSRSTMRSTEPLTANSYGMYRSDSNNYRSELYGN